MNLKTEALIEQILADMQRLEVVKRASAVAAQIKESTKVSSLIEDTKAKQKELVQAKTYNKALHKERLEQELDQMSSELANMPIVGEHERLQAEVTSLVQSMYDKLWQGLVAKLPVEMKQIPPGNCSTGGSCKCSKKGGGCGK